MEKNKENMLAMLDRMLDDDLPYGERLEAYEFLLEDCNEIVDDMLKRFYELDGDDAKMLLEVLAQYKGNKAIFMALVSYLYRGDDVALFARLIGGYGDVRGIETLKGFLNEYEPNYNEYMEIRNAIEELGGDLDFKQDFSDDPFYRYLKGLDEEEEDSRRSPFESYFASRDDDDDDECDDCDCDEHEHHH